MCADSRVRVSLAAAHAAGEPRLYVTDGSRHVGGEAAGGVSYTPVAYAPKPHWRVASADEWRQTVVESDDERVLGELIQVVAMRKEFMEPLQAFALPYQSSRDAAERVSATPQFAATCERVFQHLTPLFESVDGLRYLGVCVNRPGLCTATRHLVDGVEHFTGLHIDSWDRAPLHERKTCRQKLCVNIGVEDRFLLFIDLTLESLLARQAGSAELAPRPTPLGFEFMRSNPDYPLLKLRIRPGEAYIAPTENFVHDGSTEGACHLDVTLNFLGHLKMRAGLVAGDPLVPSRSQPSLPIEAR